MKQYKYSLDNSSKKFTCPMCKKKTFVKFIETESRAYLSDSLGRCDRESSCGYFNVPSSNGIIVKKERIIDYVETSFHSLQLVESSFLSKNRNNFIQFLMNNFPEEAVNEVVLKYLIGTSRRWDGSTVFWQIDNYECAHAGKILAYNQETGKRIKSNEGKALIDWVHSVLKRKGVIHDFNLRQCLFGLHLIRNSNAKVIGLVESEKTAVLMSLFKPEYIWMATGSKGGLKYEFLKPIQQYKIIAFPDKSEYNDWLIKAKQLNGFNFDIVVNDWLEQSNYRDGTDLADVLILEKQKCIKLGI
ncbi:DUF6371 domain-containing protein [Flavobacterium aquicola]|uniref:Toprim domain-containing protein n=1 Tax=Flavobacterium aquicola TaxID=1682742 RepID=A0A3E0EA73_9FLAO|nr:DUF6371 domain-containing protein [Flavobacterium aquicola]REG94159.1 hypothetical protein C8P67_113135 [Flavobacterium aquicola]